MYHFLIHSSADGHLCCVPILAIANSVAMNLPVHVSFSRKVLSRYMPKSGIAESYGSSMFSCLRILHPVFHSVIPIYTPPRTQCRRVPFPPPLLHHLLHVGLLMMAILTCVRWCSCCSDWYFSNNQ